MFVMAPITKCEVGRSVRFLFEEKFDYLLDCSLLLEYMCAREATSHLCDCLMHVVSAMSLEMRILLVRIFIWSILFHNKRIDFIRTTFPSTTYYIGFHRSTLQALLN